MFLSDDIFLKILDILSKPSRQAEESTSIPSDPNLQTVSKTAPSDNSSNQKTDDTRL